MCNRDSHEMGTDQHKGTSANGHKASCRFPFQPTLRYHQKLPKHTDTHGVVGSACLGDFMRVADLVAGYDMSLEIPKGYNCCKPKNKPRPKLSFPQIDGLDWRFWAFRAGSHVFQRTRDSSTQAQTTGPQTTHLTGYLTVEGQVDRVGWTWEVPQGFQFLVFIYLFILPEG